MFAYVVFIETGSWDSWERNPTRVYHDEKKAEKFVYRKNEQLKKFKNLPKKTINRFYHVWKGNNLKFLTNVNGYEFEKVRVW